MADLRTPVAWPSIGVGEPQAPDGEGLSPPAVRRVRLALLVFVGIWIFEGAVRKWSPAPPVATYFLRDLIVVGAFIGARWKSTGLRPAPLASFFEGLCLVLVGLGVLEALLNDVSPSVLVLGLRQFLTPLLFICLALRFADRAWAIRVLKVIVFAAPVQVIICLAQVVSPAQSFINQTGAGEFESMNSFGDVVRASGTFTAAFGLFCYVLLALPGFLVLLQARSRLGLSPAANRWTMISGGSLMVLPFTSGSRSILFISGLVLVLYILQGFSSRRFLSRVTVLLGALAVVSAVVFAAYSGVVTAMQDRVTTASASESSSSRVMHLVIDYLLVAPKYTVLGTGLGTHMSATNADPTKVAGTNVVGAMPLPGVEGWIENETVRWSAEAGLFGVVLSLARQLFAGYLVLVAWRLRRATGTDGWLIWALALAFPLVAGQVNGQPSAQGFVAIGLGVLLVMHAETKQREELPADP